MQSCMRKVKFDNSQSLALQQRHVGGHIPDVLTLEGWLVDDHICIQKPVPEDDAGWRVSLYPWGHLISFDFYTKADATEYAKDVSRLGIDWKSIYSAKGFHNTPEFAAMLAQVTKLRDRYEAEGFFRPEA
jgi:hypothetical protein